MELAIYQRLEQVINVTGMTNKWMRWCEQSLPNQSVFVPSVFQMRDAYCHVITMFAQGIQEQGLEGGASENCKFDEVRLFNSNMAAKQISEISGHIMRAYFDTADYIVEKLSEICKQDNVKAGGDSYPLLRSILNKHNKKINELRGQKSLLPNNTYEIVLEWDKLLQIITNAYSFADYEFEIRDLYRRVFNAALDIERNFEADVIKEFAPNFFQKKVNLVESRKTPVDYEKFKENEKESTEDILEDPVEWQKGVIHNFEMIKKELNEYLKEYELLMETIPSTALIREEKGGKNLIKKFSFGLFSLLFSTIITTWIGEKLFLSGQEKAAVLDYSFLLQICVLFILIEMLLLVIWFIANKIWSILVKKKYLKEHAI